VQPTKRTSNRTPIVALFDGKQAEFNKLFDLTSRDCERYHAVAFFASRPCSPHPLGGGSSLRVTLGDRGVRLRVTHRCLRFL
jgi:hypothetical protein